MVEQSKAVETKKPKEQEDIQALIELLSVSPIHTYASNVIVVQHVTPTKHGKTPTRQQTHGLR